MKSESLTIEKELTALYHEPTPAPEFVQRLEQQLRGVTKTRRPQPGASQHTWLRMVRWAAIAVCVFSLMGIVAVGPQRVWAALQAWIGYVPRFGFTEVENIRVLAEPVEMAAGGVVVRVHQGVVTTETTLAFEVRGAALPDRSVPGIELGLQLPDGQTLPLRYAEINFAYANGFSGFLVFPPLPLETTQATLVMDYTAIPGAHLALPLALRLAAREGFVEPFIRPHMPVNASDTRNGSTLTVTHAAYGPEETALNLQVQHSGEWGFGGITFMHPVTFTDDTGRGYARFFTTLPVSVFDRQPSVGVGQDALAFGSVATDARRLTLEVESMTFYLWDITRTFELDLGQNPRIEQTWPLDVNFTVADIQINVVQAKLWTAGMSGDYDSGARYYLCFEITGQAEERLLTGIWLRHTTVNVPLRRGDFVPEKPDTEGKMHVVTYLGFNELPTGKLTFMVDGIVFEQVGPWRVTWDMP